MKTDDQNTTTGSAVGAEAYTERHVEPISDAEWREAVQMYRQRCREAQQRHAEEMRQLIIESTGTSF